LLAFIQLLRGFILKNKEFMFQGTTFCENHHINLETRDLYLEILACLASFSDNENNSLWS